MTERPKRHSHSRARRQRAMSRREFLGLSGRTLAVGGVILVGGTGVGLYFVDQSRRSGEVNSLIEQYHQKEQELEPIIERFERGFEGFTAVAQRRMAQAGVSPAERQLLSTPFELAVINKENTKRNIHHLRKAQLEASRSTAPAKVRTDNPNFFFYDILDKNLAGIAAVFSPTGRIVGLSTNYDPNNELDNLVAYHEYFHVGQDNKDRGELPEEIYFAFFADKERRKARIALDLHEATAFASEIFLLNLLTNGEFKNDAVKGAVDPNKYQPILNSRPEQNGLIEGLGEIASKYYQFDVGLTGIHAGFLEYIRNLHRQKGMEVYTRTPRGFTRVR